MVPGATTAITEVLRHWASVHGDRPAFTFLASGDHGDDGASITFGELDRRARQLAIQLRARCQPEDRVLLVYPPGIDYIVGLLGTLYARAVAVPAYPPVGRAAARALGIAHDSTPVLALTINASLSRVERALAELGPARPACIASDELCGPDSLSIADGYADPEVPDPDTLALLQYTSGSTGTPKGVCVTHRSLMHNQRMIQGAFGSSHEDKVMAWLPLYHDMGLVGTVFHALYLGIESVLMAPAHFLQRPCRWLEAIARHGATISGGPDFAFALCVERVGPEDKARLDLTRWSIAFNGSERVRPGTLERFSRAFEECGFRSAAFRPCYGLAEATLIVTGGQPKLPSAAPVVWASVDAATPGSAPHVSALYASCGPPVSDTEVRIVDPNTGATLPEGAIGEICVRGPAVSSGYWHERRPRPDPLGKPPEPSLLRTGDLGFVQGGELFPTGRLKDLVIVRGQNYFPEDLEGVATASHPDLLANGAAAFAVDDGERERLVMVFEVRRHFDGAVPALVQAVRAALTAEYQIAADVVVLIPAGTLPRTSSGKPRRHETGSRYRAGILRTVAQWDAAQVPTEAPQDAPFDSAPDSSDAAALARWIAQQVGQQLDGTAPNVDTPIERLGLDSLAAATVAHHIERGLGRTVSPAIFAEETTLLRVAERLLSIPAAAPSLPETGATDTVALTPGQLSLWLLHKLEPTTDPYHIAMPLRLAGALELTALRAALQALCARHAALRTTIIEGPRQHIHERMPLPLTVVDAGAWPDARLHDAMLDCGAAPFDLARGPLVRFVLYTQEPERHVLLIVAHHIICDGWSLDVLYGDLVRLYAAALGGVPVEDPAGSFTAYTQWQAAHLEGADVRGQLDYWARRIVPTSAALLPVAPGADRTARRRSLTVAPALVRGVARLARDVAVSPYVVFVAALQAALAQTSGQRHVVFGTDVANRPHHWMRSIVGMIVNQVVLADEVPAQATFTQLLVRARTLVAEALRRQEVPFSWVVRATSPPRRLGTNPLFQVMFTYRNKALPAHQVQDLRFAPMGELESRHAKFDATLALTYDGTAVEGHWEFRSPAVDARHAERLACTFESLLTQALEQPDLPVADLPGAVVSPRQPATVELRSVPTTSAQTPGRRVIVIDKTAEGTLGDWLVAQREALEAHLREAGAVLFRGFRVTTIGAFQALARPLCGEPFTDNAEHTPVSQDGSVQTPVAYAKDRLLLWHNENSFNDEWPLRLAFCCLRPADSGGETPLVDSCLVLRELRADVRQRFVDKGLAYVRHFGSGLGLDWRTVFRTDDREALARYCSDHGMIAEWAAGDRLRTVAVRPAVVAHPLTGDLSWFNQAQHWHPACLDPDVRRGLEDSVGLSCFPRDCTFGDGTPIPDEDMHHVLDVYRRHQQTFPWRQGDVLVLDNVLWAHGRNPYQGRRTMLVAMGDLQRPRGAA